MIMLKSRGESTFVTLTTPAFGDVAADVVARKALRALIRYVECIFAGVDVSLETLEMVGRSLR